MPTKPPLARTPLHDWHVRRGAKFLASGPWQIANQYTTAEQEAAAARSNVGLADLSALAKVALRGPGVAEAVRRTVSGGAFQQRGVVQLLSSDGHTGSSVLACRLTDDHVVLLADSPSTESIESCLRQVELGPAMVRNDMTMALAGCGLVGPNSPAVLRQRCSLDTSFAAIPEGYCAETRLAGVHALLVRPPAIEVRATLIYVAWDAGEYVWQRLFEAGRADEIAPLGMEAWRGLTAR